MTVQGAETIRRELDYLKGTERPRISAMIAEAREHGDLKENAEYHAARESQGMCEARIKDLEAQLSTAEIIDITRVKVSGPRKVIFGATVQLEKEDGTAITYRIVGEHESDVKNGLLSYKTPIARSLMGKYAGDEVEVTTPKGRVVYYITEILYV